MHAMRTLLASMPVRHRGAGFPRRQHRGVRHAHARVFEGAAARKPIGFVAVAAGEGNAKILKSLGVAVVVKDACVAWDWAGCTVCKDECPVDGAIELDERDRPVIHADYCDGCGACERACPSASLRAYDAGVATKGIVVVSRYAQTAQIAQADQAG